MRGLSTRLPLRLRACVTPARYQGAMTRVVLASCEDLTSSPMAVPLDISPAESGSAPDVALAGSGPAEGRSLGQIAWGRLRRDEVAMTGGAIVEFLIAFLPPS